MLLSENSGQPLHTGAIAGKAQEVEVNGYNLGVITWVEYRSKPICQKGI